jgi:hypothetical protein
MTNEELDTLLKTRGYYFEKVNGSHRFYRNGDKAICVCIGCGFIARGISVSGNFVGDIMHKQFFSRSTMEGIITKYIETL